MRGDGSLRKRVLPSDAVVATVDVLCKAVCSSTCVGPKPVSGHRCVEVLTRSPSPLPLALNTKPTNWHRRFFETTSLLLRKLTDACQAPAAFPKQALPSLQRASATSVLAQIWLLSALSAPRIPASETLYYRCFISLKRVSSSKSPGIEDIPIGLYSSFSTYHGRTRSRSTSIEHLCSQLRKAAQQLSERRCLTASSIARNF